MFIGIYFLIGACSGFLAGLLGLGGGVIVVPALAVTFASVSVIPSHDIMQMAVGTSLATVVITFLASLSQHVKRGSVRWDMIQLMLPGILLGVIVGSSISGVLPSRALEKFFGLFLLFVAYRLCRGEVVVDAVKKPSHWVMRSFSSVVGVMSGMLGVGGGLILIPFLVKCGIDMRQATGTSVVCGVFIGISASICFMLLGQAPNAVPWSTGFIYWPAFFGIALASVLFAPLGTIIAYKLPVPVLKRVLALFLVFVSIEMLTSLL